MQIQSIENRNCCYIAGRPDVPSGYACVLEYEFNQLLARGVTNFLFTGLEPFERLCLETLQKLQKCYDYIPIRLTLIGSDAKWLADYQEDFDALLCLCRNTTPRHRPSRYAIQNSGFLFYYQKTDFGGAFSEISYGRDKGLCLVNVANSQMEADKYPYTAFL